MKLTITQDFTYWHGGCRRADYVAGQDVDADDQEMIDVAVSEGWASSGAAPENKAEGSPAEKPGRKPKAAPESAT